MLTAFQQFNQNIIKIRELDTLYLYLTQSLNIPFDLSDLLRSEIVYAVSALDKFIHEIVRIGMIQCFNGARTKTPSYEGFTLSTKTIEKIKEKAIERAINPTQPPLSPQDLPEFWFEQQIILSHKQESFQDPDKIAKALSFIWIEDHKWQKIASAMSYTDQKLLKTEISNIVKRRNMIVHEADIDIQTSIKLTITHSETSGIVNFIEKLGSSIYNLI